MSGYNERGRRPGDPSVELMLLIGRLQHTPPDDTKLERVSRELFDQALAMIRAHGQTRIQSRLYEKLEHVYFCGHWIAPDDLKPAA